MTKYSGFVNWYGVGITAVPMHRSIPRPSGGKVVWVIAHVQERRAHISELVESLRFD